MHGIVEFGTWALAALAAIHVGSVGVLNTNVLKAVVSGPTYTGLSIVIGIAGVVNLHLLSAKLL